jgi:hypothetical protein
LKDWRDQAEQQMSRNVGANLTLGNKPRILEISATECPKM